MAQTQRQRRRLPVLLLLLALVIAVLAAAAAAASASTSSSPAAAVSGAPRRRLKQPPAMTKARSLGGGLTVRGGAKAAAAAERRISIWAPILAAYLYNLSIGFTIPVLPKIVNMLVNNGDPKVSPESATFYGYVTTVDQAVTFLLVNGACSLSDRYGRKPFMAVANMGLGAGQVIASLAKDPRFLLLGSAIDGMTSFSYPLAQSYIADITEPSKLSQAYGLFQGVATGGAFLLGIPIAGILATKVNLKLPLYIAAGICAFNILYISAFLPESLPPAKRRHDAGLHEAHAVGAFKTVMRNPFIALVSVVYFLLHLALNGLQINFINFTQYKFGWSPAQSSQALVIIFVFTAIFPRILMPLLGIRNAIQLCSLLFAGGFFMLGSAQHTAVVIASLVIIAAGSVSLPATLALLTNQVSAAEKGAMNGAADTVRTLSTAVGFIGMTSLFGYFISDRAPFKLPGASLYAGSILSVLALAILEIAYASFEHHNNHDDGLK